MTKQELIQYITDRVDTNNSFEVSAKDVQEAIVQVVNELYDPAFSSANNLQEVLDQGSEANANSFGSMEITSAGATNNATTSIDGDSVQIEKSFIDGSSNQISASRSISGINDIYEYNNPSTGESISSFNDKGLGELRNATFFDGSFGLYDYAINSPSTDWYYNQQFTGRELSKSSNPLSHSVRGKDLNIGSYESITTYSKLQIIGETLSGGSVGERYSIYTADNSNPFGTKTIAVTTKAENDSFEPKATWSIDGGLQVTDMQEETSTPEYVIVPDADGVIKKYPFPLKEDLFEQFRLDGGETLQLDKFYSSVNIGFNSSGDITIKLPNPLTEEHIGDWFFFNEGNQGSTITVLSEDINGLYNSGLIPASGSLTLKVVRVKTGTNAFVSKFVEIQKDTV